MNQNELSQEQLELARKIIAKENGSKGGANWWKSLTNEQQQERIEKMQKTLKEKRNEKKKSNQ